MTAVRPDHAAVATTVLQAQGLGVELSGRPILSEVDLDVSRGELLALVGPNGAGKSTLLATLCGDRAPTAGAVLMDGRPLDRWPGRELARRRAVLLQQVTVSFPFTVRQVVLMGRAPWVGTDQEDDDDLVFEQVVAESEIGHLLDRSFPSLSGGERARAATARVLAQSTPTLLLDEPTAALDIRHQELLFRLLRSRARAGHAVVVVVHDLALAGAYADRITVLSSGRVVADGVPESVLQPDLLTDVYGYPVEVLTHPRTGRPVVVPVRE